MPFSEIYFYALSLVGASALLMIIIAAIKYIYAGDNESQVKDAKDMIYSAIFGLILALTSYIILNTINPALLGLKEISDIQTDLKKIQTNNCQILCPTGQSVDLVGCQCISIVEEQYTQCPSCPAGEEIYQNPTTKECSCVGSD